MTNKQPAVKRKQVKNCLAIFALKKKLKSCYIITMNIEKQVDYWRKSAAHDLSTAESLIKEKKFDWALFLGHLGLEKILKAIYIKKIGCRSPNIDPRVNSVKSE